MPSEASDPWRPIDDLLWASLRRALRDSFWASLCDSYRGLLGPPRDVSIWDSPWAPPYDSLWESQS